MRLRMRKNGREEGEEGGTNGEQKLHGLADRLNGRRRGVDDRRTDREHGGDAGNDRG